MTIIGLIFAVLWTSQVNSRQRETAPADFLTGPRFHAELNQATSGSWTNVELRSLLRQLSEEKGVAILLDRRIDPTVRMPFDIANQSLADGLRGIARQVKAAISIPENVVYVGPQGAVHQLRTLIELRSSELPARTGPVGERRRMELNRRQAIAWNDLESPAEILQRVADQFQLTIGHAERVPHDLWGGCRLPAATAVEALSLILIQFDLTFAWVDGGTGIDLIPIPTTVAVERRPRAKGSAGELLQRIREAFPELDVRLDGSDVVVAGTVEEQEAVVALLNPSKSKKPTEKGATPLRQRTFTLKFERVPVRAVMKKLEESSVIFVYDAAVLEAAGINLDQTIDLQLEKATAEEFLKALFSPLKIVFEIDQLTVRLSPRK